MCHSLKALAVGALRPDIINLAFSPEVGRESAYSERSVAWNEEAEEIEYCRLL